MFYFLDMDFSMLILVCAEVVSALGETSKRTPPLSPTATTNPCSDMTCENGGSCHVTSAHKAKCLCKVGYKGKTCADKDPTCGGTCEPHGTCELEMDEYMCKCAPGYCGERCKKTVNSPSAELRTNQTASGMTDVCSGNPCLNGGECVNAGGGQLYYCICKVGFSGSDCEINTDECQSNPCGNRGTCEDGVAHYTCHCAKGYAGRRCEITPNKCAGSPCGIHGTCVDGGSRYTCVCADGFTGEHCEIDVNECASKPCFNGGHCVDGAGGYECRCTPGFTGKNCDEKAVPLNRFLALFFVSGAIMLGLTAVVIMCLCRMKHVARQQSYNYKPINNNASDDSDNESQQKYIGPRIVYSAESETGRWTQDFKSANVRVLTPTVTRGIKSREHTVPKPENNNNESPRVSDIRAALERRLAGMKESDHADSRRSNVTYSESKGSPLVRNARGADGAIPKASTTGNNNNEEVGNMCLISQRLEHWKERGGAGEMSGCNERGRQADGGQMGNQTGGSCDKNVVSSSPIKWLKYFEELNKLSIKEQGGSTAPVGRHIATKETEPGQPQWPTDNIVCPQPVVNDNVCKKVSHGLNENVVPVIQENKTGEADDCAQVDVVTDGAHVTQADVDTTSVAGGILYDIMTARLERKAVGDCPAYDQRYYHSDQHTSNTTALDTRNDCVKTTPRAKTDVTENDNMNDTSMAPPDTKSPSLIHKESKEGCNDTWSDTVTNCNQEEDKPEGDVQQTFDQLTEKARRKDKKRTERNKKAKKEKGENKNKSEEVHVGLEAKNEGNLIDTSKEKKSKKRKKMFSSKKTVQPEPVDPTPVKEIGEMSRKGSSKILNVFVKS